MKYSIRYRVVRTLQNIGINFDASKSEAIIDMKKTISGLSSSSLQISITRSANGDWVAESVNIPGIITGGTSADDVNEMTKDAIFTYFEIPPEYCNSLLIREIDEPVVTKQEIYATA